MSDIWRMPLEAVLPAETVAALLDLKTRLGTAEAEARPAQGKDDHNDQKVGASSAAEE